MAGDERRDRYGDHDGSVRILTPRGQRTRAALIAAAKQIFEQTPFAEVRIVDITAAAGVASGTFYTYFDSKEEIFREVAAAVLDEMWTAGHLEIDDLAVDPIEHIRSAGRGYFLACIRNAGVARSMEQLAVTDQELARVRRNTVIAGVKRVNQWIRDLQTRGICDAEIDSWGTAIALHTMSVRVAYDHLMSPGNDKDIERLVDAATHIWARAVGLETVTSSAAVTTTHTT